MSTNNIAAHEGGISQDAVNSGVGRTSPAKLPGWSPKRHLELRRGIARPSPPIRGYRTVGISLRSALGPPEYTWPTAPWPPQYTRLVGCSRHGLPLRSAASPA